MPRVKADWSSNMADETIIEGAEAVAVEGGEENRRGRGRGGDRGRGGRGGDRGDRGPRRERSDDHGPEDQGHVPDFLKD